MKLVKLVDGDSTVTANFAGINAHYTSFAALFQQAKCYGFEKI